MKPRTIHRLPSLIFGLILFGQVIPAFAADAPEPPPNDALIPPADYLSLRSMDVNAPGANDAPGYYDTSVYAIGTVAVGIVLPESNGAIDASTENWTAQEIANVKSEVQEALTWWEGQAPAAADLHFVLDAAAPRVVATSYEPINRSQSQEGLWIAEVLGNLGYSSGTYFERSTAYINALRTQYNTDWAFVIFVANSFDDEDGYFLGHDYFAYAYLGGPFMVMTYDNDGWGINNMGQVSAHEMGHIFLAGDQYAGSNCSTSQYYGYLGVQHTWCNSGGDSLMKGGYVLSANDPARGQFGWRDTDADGIPDPIDAAPTVTLPAHTPNPTAETSFAYTGTVEANPWLHASCSSGYCWNKDINLTRMFAMDFQLDGGSWQTLSATDGAFDEELEGFSFNVGPLTGGAHTITARGTSTFNRSGAPSTVSGTSSDPVTISGPLAPGVYDDKFSGLSYIGTWTNYSNSKAYSGSFRYSTRIGNSVSFTFEGSKFGLIYLIGSAYGNMDVFVDGAKIATINQYSPTMKWQQVYTSPTLTNTIHVVRFALASGSRGNVDAIRTYGPPDVDPPAAITNLSASTGTSNGSVNLSWSAPAEDASSGTGTVTSYLVRYSLSPINGTNWSSATPATTGLPTPSAPGTLQQMTVSGLVPGLTYYFAVRAQDDEPNLGGVSNTPISAVAQFPAPLGAGKYDDKNASWIYFGKWSNVLSYRAYNSSMKTSAVIGNSACFVFTGTNFIMGYVSYSSYGTLDVYVDGVYVTTINQSGASALRTFTLSAPLTAGQHTVQFVHKTGTRVNVDSIQILP